MEKEMERGSKVYVIYLSFLRKRRERSVLVKSSLKEDSNERVLVKPSIEKDSSIADLDEVASSEDSDEPGTTCKKEALVEVHDDLVDSDKRH